MLDQQQRARSLKNAIFSAIDRKPGCEAAFLSVSSLNGQLGLNPAMMQSIARQGESLLSKYRFADQISSVVPLLYSARPAQCHRDLQSQESSLMNQHRNHKHD